MTDLVSQGLNAECRVRTADPSARTKVLGRDDKVVKGRVLGRDDRAKVEERRATSEQRTASLLLLNGLDGFGMDLLVLDLRGVPASAERLDQVNRRNHLLAEELRRQPLVGQQRQLCGDDIEVARDSADVAVVGKLQSATR